MMKYKNIFYEKLLTKYQIAYHNESIFNKLSIECADKLGNVKNYLLTIEENNNQKKINNHGYPFDLSIFYEDQYIYEKFIIQIKKFCFEKKINSILFKEKTDESKISQILKKNFLYIDYIGIENTIILEQNIETIFSNFSKGHKSAIKIKYDNLTYELIDSKNYKQNEILEMMNMHEVVSGKKTRSKETWFINEEMILKDKGALVRVKDNTKTISFSFFFFNQEEAIYFSSCTLRDNFKKYKNISHTSIWEAIKYLKSRNCKRLLLGNCKNIYSKNILDKKSESINLFKSSFGGKKNYYVLYNNILGL